MDKLEAACRQEHGGKYYEPECPICEALREIDMRKAPEPKGGWRDTGSEGYGDTF
jgi:hypothetical protein